MSWKPSPGQLLEWACGRGAVCRVAAQGIALGPRRDSYVSCTSHICLWVIELSPSLSMDTLPISCSLCLPGHWATPGDGQWSITGEVLASSLGGRGWLGSGMFPGVGTWTTWSSPEGVRWPMKAFLCGEWWGREPRKAVQPVVRCSFLSKSPCVFLSPSSRVMVSATGSGVWEAILFTHQGLSSNCYV